MPQGPPAAAERRARRCDRDVAEFETDDHKQCVMHKTRATKLEPLVQVLSPTAFPSLYWSLRMEIASAYREIMLIKEEHKRPYGKVWAIGAQPEPFS